MKIYVASSWRNKHQPEVVQTLRREGFEVYDFREDGGFHWSDVDPEWEDWNFGGYMSGLAHPISQDGFNTDFENMKSSDACVLVLPCGRSANLEAGYFVGAGKPLFIYIPEMMEPELMYNMATGIFEDLPQIVSSLKGI